jgi:hypothetical protein
LIPFRSEFKVIGNMPLWKGFEASVVWQNDPEFLRYLSWTVTKTTRYPVDCSACPNDPSNASLKALVAPTLTNPSEVIPLLQPGAKYQDRLNQLDVGIKRTFHIKEKLRVVAQLDVFNVNNAHTVLVQTQSLGTRLAPAAGAQGPDYRLNGLGGTPTQILQARLLRLAVQVHF